MTLTHIRMYQLQARVFLYYRPKVDWKAWDFTVLAFALKLWKLLAFAMIILTLITLMTLETLMTLMLLLLRV